MLRSYCACICHFDDSVENINIDRVLLSMKSEIIEGRVGRKKLFDLSSKYGIDMCTIILTVIFYCYIRYTKNVETTAGEIGDN